MAKGFSVDTHIFRELGELLVGRDSTALVELIKNAYDADAETVRVTGVSLSSVSEGYIVIEDDGTGMTSDIVETGFLRIASRAKEVGERRSPRHGRRFTGAKGVGRLAAHKLGRRLELVSVPDLTIHLDAVHAVRAIINWEAVEQCETLESVAATNAVIVTEEPIDGRAPGTRIEIRNFRRAWSEIDRARFLWEVETFQPPFELLKNLESYASAPLLIDRARVYDTTHTDPGFDVQLDGDFAVGEEYWSALVGAASWLIEIVATAENVTYQVTPLARAMEELPDATVLSAEMPHPDPVAGPFFHSRILVREGQVRGKRPERMWVGRHTGVRIYMEGFRVLPYGERGDDWLELDLDYSLRTRTLRFLDRFSMDLTSDRRVLLTDDEHSEGSLVSLRNQAYFGAVFLTTTDAPTLQMIVNREGFIPSSAFEVLKSIVRAGIDLSVRHRASARSPEREEWRKKRRTSRGDDDGGISSRVLGEVVKRSVATATELALRAQTTAHQGDIDGAVTLIAQAAEHFLEGAEAHDRMLTEPTMMRILAGVGLQMTAFVHEIRALVGMIRSVEGIVARLQVESSAGSISRSMQSLAGRLQEVRQVVERQASYLTDIASPDARRRRSRQRVRQRVDSALRLLLTELELRQIVVRNEVDESVLTPPMFASEMSIVLTNLLSNAIKATGGGGTIFVSASMGDDLTVVRVENTGVAVSLRESERWFLPFESTTVENVSPALGQGMGMGLPIVRQILEEYGGWVRFVSPSHGFQTAVEVTLPRG